jgi:hypothetical protein
MIQDVDKFEELPPEKARYVLAETKLKLMNLMSHLELIESRLAYREKTFQSAHLIVETRAETVSKSNPAQH